MSGLGQESCEGNAEEVSLEGGLEVIDVGAGADGDGEGVPEGGGGDAEGSVPQGSVLGHGGLREEVGFRRAEGSAGGMRDKEVGEVGWGQVVEGLESEEENLVLDAEGNGKPVELMEDGGDVVVGAGACEDPGSRVLDELEFMEGGGWEAVI